MSGWPSGLTPGWAAAAGLTLDANNNVLEAILSLPGGVLYTDRSATKVWSYPNLHGDVAATADNAGAKQGATYSYDPYEL